jgi:hypothetical protein
VSSVEEDGGAGKLNAGEKNLGELVEETLNEGGMTGAIARALRAPVKGSASNALSAINAPGSTASIHRSDLERRLRLIPAVRSANGARRQA